MDSDLVVLDRDILLADPETIEDTKVLTTYLDGRLIYTAPVSGLAEVPEDEEVGEREARMRDWLHRD